MGKFTLLFSFSEEKTLSAAARKLGVDHATVARRIAQLEDNLKLKLVDRRPRTYILTSEGASGQNRDTYDGRNIFY